jgi:hypothetical protein
MHSAVIEQREELGISPGGCCLGVLVAVTPAGGALVDFPGNRGGPVEARTILTLAAADRERCGEGTPVLLWFEHDEALPIIVGLVRDQLFANPPQPPEPAKPRPEVVVDKRTLVLDAREEIVLRCGKSSLTLQKDGKIVVKGTHLISRSSGVNKIKGAVVTIN